MTKEHTSSFHRLGSWVRRTLPLTLAIAACATTAWADDTVMAADKTLDEVIACNIETRGGLDAMKAAKGARMNGKMMMGPGMEAPFEVTFQRPGKVRMEFEVQGMVGIQAYDGENGWGVMPFMGQTEPAALADDQLKQIQDQADFDGPLVDYAEKGHSIELLGKVDVEGTEAYKLKVTKKNGDVVTSYLDTENCLEFMQEARTTIQGNEIGFTTEIGDYKEVEGLILPHSMTQTFEGAPAGQTFTIESIVVNPEIEGSVFVMPEAAAEKDSE